MSLGQEDFLVLFLIRKAQRRKCHHITALSLGYFCLERHNSFSANALFLRNVRLAGLKLHQLQNFGGEFCFGANFTKLLEEDYPLPIQSPALNSFWAGPGRPRICPLLLPELEEVSCLPGNIPNHLTPSERLSFTFLVTNILHYIKELWDLFSSSIHIHKQWA